VQGIHLVGSLSSDRACVLATPKRREGELSTNFVFIRAICVTRAFRFNGLTL
jgi:hypothetical protein